MEFAPLEKSQLSELVNLWNKHLKDEFPMTEELFEQNSFKDENVCQKSSRVVVDDQGKIVGFIIAKRWQEALDVAMSATTGWIQALLIDESVRSEGLGSNLLSHAESTLKETGAEQILLGRDPYHYFPGIPSEYAETAKWFEEKGYHHQGTEYDLMRTYTSDDEDTKTVPVMDHVEFTLLDKKDKDEFLAFLNRCFPGRWEYEAIHYFQKGGSGREFAVLKKGKKMIGFCRINDAKSPFIAQNVYWAPLFNEELGGAGPLGVDANERGQGFGLAIVEAGIAFLRQRGIRRIAIDWTGLVDFYKKLGYSPWKSYESYKKTIV